MQKWECRQEQHGWSTNSTYKMEMKTWTPRKTMTRPKCNSMDTTWHGNWNISDNANWNRSFESNMKTTSEVNQLQCNTYQDANNNDMKSRTIRRAETRPKCNRHETNHVEDNSQSKQVQTTGSNSTIPKHPKYIDQQILANTQVTENFPIHIQFKSKNHNFHFKNHVYPDQFRLCIWIREL